jgi:lipoprotein-releasing system permease protein
VAGIAAGVASLIVAQALGRGFRQEMQEKVLANTAHIQVFRNDGGGIADWNNIERALSGVENVSGVSPTAYETAVLIGPRSAAPAMLRVTENTGKPGLMIGAELAEKAGVLAGDRADLVVLENDAEPRTVQVTVGGTFRTGLFDYDAAWVNIGPRYYASLHGLQSFTPTQLNVELDDINSSPETAAAIRSALGSEYRVLDWQEANRPLFEALALERRTGLAVISLIVIIAALNITTTLALLVNERRLDVAVLRTCGASTRSLLLLFVLEGSVLGLLGTLFGTAAGLLACWLGNRFQVAKLSAEVYSLGLVPLSPALTDLISIAAAALAISLLAALYPAFAASRLKPMENLRNR